MGLRNNPFMQYIRKPASEDDEVKQELPSQPAEVSMDGYSKIIEAAKELTPEKKEYGWGDLLIAAAPAIAGGLTGYGAAGAQAGLDAMKVQQADIEQKNKDAKDIYKSQLGLLGKYKVASPKEKKLNRQITEGEKDKYVVDLETAQTFPLNIGAQKKPSAGKGEALYIERAPEGANLGRYKVGEDVYLSPEEQEDLRSKGVVLRKAYANTLVTSPQTAESMVVSKMKAGQVFSAPGSIGSAFTPEGYANIGKKGGSMTKEQLHSYQKDVSSYASKIEPVKDTLQTTDLAIKHLDSGDVMGLSDAVNLTVKNTQGGHASDADRAYSEEAKGKINQLQEAIEKNLTGDVKRLRREIKNNLIRIKQSMRSRMGSEQSLVVNKLANEGIKPEFVKKSLGVQERTKVRDQNNKLFSVPNEQLESFLKAHQGFKVEK